MDQRKPDLRIGVRRLRAGAVLPLRVTSGSSGYDLSSAEDTEIVLDPGSVSLIRTGIALELGCGFEAQVRSRSGLAASKGVFVLNSPGTIDSDYRGEIKVVLANFGPEPHVVKPGDRIAQMVFMQLPEVTLDDVSELSVTERGEGGFGSSGS